MPKSKHRARSLLFRAPFSVFYSQGPARTSSDSRCLSYGIGGIGGPELSCKVDVKTIPNFVPKYSIELQ
ncbi:Hypothetical protein CINCED_3A006202 [Cinara cedri]|uniref:Uncharacterized protein n=1 Tax=Cinara cedri TaxID=506608 RepID=A0A5E4MCI0_9HEMI|nr:Hypothetical protein CINCED_3A006202 [Cinara cedri]